MPDQLIIDQARYIFTTGKLLRHHIFNSLSRIESQDRGGGLCSEISLAQFNLLMTIQGQGPITCGQLAERLGVSPPSVSVMVDRLVDKGFLVRERSSQDRRKVLLRISDHQSERFRRIEETLLAGFIQLVEAVGRDTAEKWVDVLRQVEQVLTATPLPAAVIQERPASEVRS